MLSTGNIILIAGLSIVFLLCWAWVPFALVAKLLGLGGHRKKLEGDLLPVRATAGEVRYRAEGFVPPSQALQDDPQAFDPEARHHEFLKTDPRLAEQHFKTRETRDAYEATFGLGRTKSMSAASATQQIDGGVQKPAATLSRNQGKEVWEKADDQAEDQQWI
ncbi:hypothetical protein KVR01_010949 [Diaporthe batatas]|uniref:uncharacterized protein n=1 Tax=Diaporthe batatas TaxID=748121 RepID=UPI001D05BEAF|nr:uncharacterized protein KVR01_010949 [Diaporthe batatas]KAG8159288.1 hypothetical protein KVR01_010949 [Diaporthe batatas]